MGLLSYTFPCSYITPGLIILATTFILTLTLSKPLRGYGYADPFAWHAAFMIMGFGCLMPLGALSYAMDFGRRGNAAFPTQDARRSLHGILMFFAALCVLVGFTIAFACHERGCGPHAIQPHLPWTWEPAANSPSVRSAHVIIGYIAVAATLAQAAIGMYKAVTLTKTGTRVFQLHGLLGPIVWLLGLLNIAIAAFIEYLEKDEKPPKTAWNAAQTTAITVSLATVFVATVLHMRCAGKRHLAAEGGSHSLLGEEDEEDASFSAN